VLIDAEPDHTISDLLPQLVTTAGPAGMHPSFALRVGVWVDGRAVNRESTLREVDLRPGSVLALHEPRGNRAGLPRGVAEIRVAAGPGAGRVHRVGLGESVLGCGAPGLSLPDVMLPADALTLQVTVDGVVTVAPGEGVEAFLEDQPLVGATTWPPTSYLRCGRTVLLLVPPWEPDADATPSEDRLGVDFNRPPRLLPAPRERSFTLPAKPAPPRKMSIPWVMVLAPMAMAVPTAFIFDSPRYLLFGLMSPLMAVFNFVSGKRAGARQYKESKAQYDVDLSTVQARLGVALATERSDRRNATPDPAEVLLNAVGPGRRLWERRRTDPDYLSWRLGLADLPSLVTVTDKNVKDIDELPGPMVVTDVPVVMSLRHNGVVGVAGEPEVAEAVARWLVGQSAVLHSPRDVRVVIMAGPQGEQRWGWTRWLPHCRVEDEVIPALLGTEQDSVGLRVGEMSNLVAQRLAEMEGPGRNKDTPAPDYVVVLDGARRLRALPGIVALLRDGPSVGVNILCLDADERSLPEECRAIIACTTEGLTLHQSMAEDVLGIRADQVESAWADRIGRALAPVRDATPSEDDAALPRSARLLECIDLEEPSPEAIAAGWTDQAQTDVVIGSGYDGPFRLDLRRDGPHALIAGTTGSGKSELLQTIVASLAVANRPDQLSFVLVDYKGGSAFKECNKLPHTVGMVTDLDTHLVGRALSSLGAELRRREHLLAIPGAKDLEDYAALQRVDPSLPTIPRLVLVIDEFASLKAELPDFVTGLVTIAQRGRSLGLHLILATQRPSGVVSADIRANTNLRIALRVTDESESRDVIDAPDSGRIAASTPGRGYARIGPSAVLPFQTGRVGGRRPGVASQVQAKVPPLAWSIPWARVGLPAPSRPKPPGLDTDEGQTDLSVLVEAVNGAGQLAGIELQRSPWLPALPAVVTLDDLRAHLAANDPKAASRHTSVPWALEDRPDDQEQIARTFTLGKDGHLCLIGGARSGRSTVLRTIAGALAQSVPARDLNIYGLDCGNGALLPLTTLPHTGAVVQRSEVERASRLLQLLTQEVGRRQGVLGRDGFADIDEQRDAAVPDEKLPYVVLFLDRWEGFMSDLSELDMGRLFDAIMVLLREGASVGVQVIMTGDRTLLNGRVASMVEQRFVMRLPDRSDYSSAGLRPKEMPENLGEGRGLWADIAVEAQVAVLSEDTSGAGQSAALRAIAASVAERDADLPVALQPVRLGVLPGQVEASQVLPLLDPSQESTMFVPMGIGGDRLELLGVDLSGSPVAVVAGPPRSGRTNTLQMVAMYAAQTGRSVVGFTPRQNALTTMLGQARCVVGVEHEPEVVAVLLRQLGSGSLIVVDDAGALREGPMGAVMTALVQQARDKGWGLVIAGQNEDLSGGFSGWIHEARKGRQGIVLSPQEPLAGDLFGGRVQRTSLQPRITPGRAVLFDGSGDQMLIQVPKVS
jgi:S-DNA-T family DNA segregation ATPase FtsK/SpoIIIE